MSDLVAPAVFVKYNAMSRMQGQMRRLIELSTETCKRKASKVAGQTLDCYCVCCELLSASIADALLFVNMVCFPQIT